MPVPRLLAAVLTVASVSVSAPVSAQVQFATQTGVAIIAPCPSFCGGPGGRFAFDADGGEALSSSDSSASDADGNGQARADLTGPTALGILKAEARSLGSSRASALASAMQGFYVGSDGLDNYTLETTLTGQATGAAHVTVAIFRDTDPGSPFAYTEDGPTLLLEVYPGTPDLDGLQTIDLELAADGSPRSVSGAITVTGLQRGDLFYVWATLEVVGRDGTYADALHTVNMAFIDPTGLSQTAPVPEPESWAMLIAGIGMLALLGGTPAAGRAGDRGVVINGEPLGDEQVRTLESTYHVPLMSGRYWYDRATGWWGLEGGATAGVVTPGLSVGGPLAPDASRGGSRVFLNGRELDAVEANYLRTLGPVIPGRYWVDAGGNVGVQGQAWAFTNLYALMQQRYGNRGPHRAGSGAFNGEGGCLYYHGKDATGGSIGASTGC